MYTIEEFEEASPKEREEAMKLVTVEQDLYAYLKWLNSPKGGETRVNFKVGWNPHRAASKGFHPSQICKPGICKLKVYYDVTGEVEPDTRIDCDMLMTFDIGTAGHAILQTHFLNMYEDQFEEEVWLRDERILINSTHTDGRFTFNDVRFLMEIKTIKEGGNYGWEKIQTRPFPDNVRQVMTYMYLDDCPFGLIFYWCKNNGKVKEHPIAWDRKIWEKLKEENMDPITEAVDEGKVPVPTPGWDCRKCDYLHGCRAGKDYVNGQKGNKRRRAVSARDRGRYVRNNRSRR